MDMDAHVDGGLFGVGGGYPEPILFFINNGGLDAGGGGVIPVPNLRNGHVACPCHSKIPISPVDFKKCPFRMSVYLFWSAHVTNVTCHKLNLRNISVTLSLSPRVACRILKRPFRYVNFKDLYP